MNETTNIQDTANDIIATEIMLNIQRGAGRDWDVAYALSDDDPDEDYYDGWGWAILDTDEQADLLKLAQLTGHKPEDIEALEDYPNDNIFSTGPCDCLIGFRDGTHWRIIGQSAFDLMRTITRFDYLND